MAGVFDVDVGIAIVMTVVGLATWEVVALPSAIASEDPDELESLAAPQFPVSCPSCLVPTDVTSASGPGFGKKVSLPSTVLQPLLRFALKMSGRSEYATAGADPDPDPMVTLALIMKVSIYRHRFRD